MQVTQEQLVASAVEAFEKATGQKNLSDAPPEGYYTARQWNEMLNRGSIDRTRIMLEGLVKKKLASKEFYRHNGQPTAHYKMKETK